MTRLLVIILSLVLWSSPDRVKPSYVTCYDAQGHRVEFVVFTPPASQAQFCLDRGLLPRPPYGVGIMSNRQSFTTWKH